MFTSDRGKLNVLVTIRSWPILCFTDLTKYVMFSGCIVFLSAIKARAMKLGIFIHLVEGSWMHLSN